ncbi:alpha/beta fold hydrolase [Actinomadura sp. NPDC048021]|uniref:alpha/beta hydrolase family protein n=1 Tax=Actinomadura sp. NPDC048021 TaxID=3155385 RepID=UPI0033F7BF98
MTETLPDLPPVPSRFGFAFSADGRWATCLRSAQDSVVLERWDLTWPRPSLRTLDDAALPGRTEERIIDRGTGALPLNDGRVLVVRPAVGEHGEPAGHGTLATAEPTPAGLRITRSWPVPRMLAGFLLAAPGQAQVAVLVVVENERHSRIWRVSPASPVLEPVLRIPGVLSGGVWADEGRVLALDRDGAGQRTEGILVDLRERGWRPFWSVSDTTGDRIAAYSPRSGVLAVTTTLPGAQQRGAPQIGLRLPGGGPVRFPETLNRSAAHRTPLAFDASGERLLVREIAGATARLAVYATGSDRISPVPGPPGMLWPPAHWAGDGRIHVRFSAPHQPPTLATVRSPARSGWDMAAHPSDGAAAWRHAELVELSGPAGPVEAIVYGGPGWRDRPRLVLALHGGPLSAWRYEFEPLFQYLAAAGASVVAPNYRGSTGYGDDHLRPVIGDWGGPDLDDVVHLGHAIAHGRGAALPRPVVLGASYGGFLALLAACRAPDLWTGCVALAPFTSASGLHRTTTGMVRDRVSRLGLADTGDDEDARRDVLRACETLTAPLLVAHGVRDEAVPVEQSRALRRRLLELGRTEGVDFDYLETADDHNGVVQAWSPVLRQAVVRFCLTAGRTLALDNERR